MCSTPIWTTGPGPGDAVHRQLRRHRGGVHPEGYNTQQIFQLLSENGVAPVEELEEAAANYEFVDYAFLDSDLLGDVRRVEGYLYPDTYQFYVGRSAVAALDSMLSNFNSGSTATGS